MPIKNSLCLFFNEIELSREILRKVLRAYVGLKDSILDVIASLFAVCIGRKKQTEGGVVKMVRKPEKPAWSYSSVGYT